jgi:hypothetical protein
MLRLLNLISRHSSQHSRATELIMTGSALPAPKSKKKKTNKTPGKGKTSLRQQAALTALTSPSPASHRGVKRLARARDAAAAALSLDAAAVPWSAVTLTDDGTLVARALT